MKRIAALFLMAAWLLDLSLGVHAIGPEFSFSGLGILFLLALPYLLGLGLLWFSRTHPAIRFATVLTIFLALAGSALLIDTLILHPDPQSGLAFFTVGFYGFAIVLIGWGVSFWLNRRSA